MWKRLGLITLMVMVWFSYAWAGPASPDLVEIPQPDGTIFYGYLHGDENVNWVTTEEGYTVVKSEKGQWQYAVLNGTKLVPSGVPAEEYPPADMPRGLMPKKSKARVKAMETPAESSRETWNPQPVSGSKNMLVVVVSFNDRAATISNNAWYNSVFSTTSSVKSVANYYNDNSFGTLSVNPISHSQSGSPTGVVSISLNMNHPNYGGNYNYATEKAWIQLAVNEVRSVVNLASYDTNGNNYLEPSELVVYFIVAGYERSGTTLTPNVWAHAWGSWSSDPVYVDSGNSVILKNWAMNGELNGSSVQHPMGVIAHELGHQMCDLPDLYDINSINGAMGYFSIMASGSWGADTGEDSGTTPTGLDAWSRQYLGWTTPMEPTNGQSVTLGHFQASANNAVKLIDTSQSSTEYWLAEVRYPTGWDRGIRGKTNFSSSWQGGLLIIHVDDNIGTPGSNDINAYVYGSHQGVVPEQASTSSCSMISGTCRGAPTTLFYSGNNDSFTDSTSPSAKYYDGSSSGMGITSVSSPGSTMTFVASGTGGGGTTGKAEMTSPANGSTLSGSSQLFQWTSSSSASKYWLYVGSSQGGSNYYTQDQSLNTSVTVTGLPTDGSTVYVRLWTQISSTWEYNDYTYTAYGGGSAKAEITSPTPGSTLAGASETFAWTTGTGADLYHLYVGSSQGGYNYYNQGQGTNTSVTVSGLPIDGSTVYVRLWTHFSTGWEYNDYTFTAATGSAGKAEITSPTPGSTLAGASETFAWTTGSGADLYHLYVGSSQGGYNYYNQGQGTNTSVTVSGLPIDGSTVYVRLWTHFSTGWEYNDYTFTAATGSAGKAEITSPTPGSTLAGASETFAWTTGSGADLYHLYVGSSQGGYNYYNQGQGTNTSVTVSGLPIDGSTVYVRLWTHFSTGWEYNDYTFTAATGSAGKAEITSPTPGSTLAGASETFAWTTGSGADLYHLYVGSSQGGYNYYNQGQGTNTSVTVSGLPTDGSTVYVRLWTHFSTGWEFNDYTYTAATASAAAAEMTSPTPGSTLAGASETFAWTTGTGVSLYHLYVGSSQGSYNYYNQGQGTNTSVTVSGLPTDGSTVYVRLWSYISSTGWTYNDYTYTAAAASSAKAEMTSPAQGSTLAGASETFAWTTGSGADMYWLYIGSSQGGYNYYNQGQGTNTSVTASGLPVDGSTVYVRLWTHFSTGWEYNDYTYTAASGSGAAAEMTSPTPGSTLSGSSETFAWTTGSGASLYHLYVGSSQGGYEYYNQSQGTNTSVTVSGLPTNGSTVYVRLWTYISGTWHFNDYTYTASSNSGASYVISHSQGAQLSGTELFQWQDVGAPEYWVWWGTSQGGSDVYTQSQGTNTSNTFYFTGWSGQQIWMRLWTRTSTGTWLWEDTYYYAPYQSSEEGPAVED